ncbi:protein yippee-like 3 isoform X1 [Mobula birostris]|uniref:protein yippee-like 3 isoform X1 n=1 Tax=Mobula birostris TaxID=1983395 RepID=UPI003B28B044
MVKMTRSKTFQAYLPTCHRTYSCIHCRAHLANHDELISKMRVQRRFARMIPGTKGLFKGAKAELTCSTQLKTDRILDVGCSSVCHQELMWAVDQLRSEFYSQACMRWRIYTVKTVKPRWAGNMSTPLRAARSTRKGSIS